MKHTLVWIDKEGARVLEIDGETVQHSLVHSPGPHLHRHANERDLRVRDHPDDEHRFFREVARAIEGTGQVLIVGPAKTKLHFFRYVQQHDRLLDQRIIGLETVDHPTDPQLVAHLRSYFHESPPRHGP